MKIKEIIVVEGKDDTVAIQQAVHADTIETGGSALNKEKLERIRLAQERRGVIVFTDPDYPGERIRKLISQAIPGCKHAFLPRKKAVSKQGKYGVEHASPEDIRQALQATKTEEFQETEEQISWLKMQEYGLVGEATSQKLRARIGEELGIGYCNAKQFYKRLIAFCISYEEFKTAYDKAIQETSTDE
jgi:ribonuclease M5